VKRLKSNSLCDISISIEGTQCHKFRIIIPHWLPNYTNLLIVTLYLSFIGWNIHALIWWFVVKLTSVL